MKSGIFPIKSIQNEGLKILSPKKMLQRLPIALEQEKTSNISETLLNEIMQIIYSLYQAKKNYWKCKQQYNEFNKVLKL